MALQLNEIKSLNLFGLYFLVAEASGFYTICHYQGFHVSYLQ